MSADIVVLCDVRDCAKIDRETRSLCTGGADSKIHIKRLQCQDYVMDKEYLNEQLKEHLNRREISDTDYAKSTERISTRMELDAPTG